MKIEIKKLYEVRLILTEEEYNNLIESFKKSKKSTKGVKDEETKQKEEEKKEKI